MRTMTMTFRGLAGFALALLALACSEPVAPVRAVLGTQLSLAAEEPAQADTVARGRRFVARIVQRLAAGAQAPQQEVPMPSQLVHFRVLGGGGSVYTDAELSNSAGEVRNIWRLGTQAGAQVLQAYWVDQDTGDSVAVADTLQALPDTVADFPVDTAPATLLVGERLALRARIAGPPVDRYGNPVPDAPVRFTAPAGWGLAADTVWAVAVAEGVARIGIGSRTVGVAVRSVVRQLADGAAYDVSFACVYEDRAGARDSVVWSLRTDSAVYGRDAHADARLWASGGSETYGSDGLRASLSGWHGALPVLRESVDTLWWGERPGQPLGASVRTAPGWAGGDLCPFVAGGSPVPVAAVLTRR